MPRAHIKQNTADTVAKMDMPAVDSASQQGSPLCHPGLFSTHQLEHICLGSQVLYQCRQAAVLP